MKNIKTFEGFSDWFKSKGHSDKEVINKILTTQGTPDDHRKVSRLYSETQLEDMSGDEIEAIWNFIETGEDHLDGNW